MYIPYMMIYTYAYPCIYVYVYIIIYDIYIREYFKKYSIYYIVYILMFGKPHRSSGSRFARTTSATRCSIRARSASGCDSRIFRRPPGK